MTCREFIEFLDEYREGNLPEAQRKAFEEHMTLCPSCVAYLSNYEDTIDLAREALGDPEASLPDDVPEDLVAAILAARSVRETRH